MDNFTFWNAVAAPLGLRVNSYNDGNCTFYYDFPNGQGGSVSFDREIGTRILALAAAPVSKESKKVVAELTPPTPANDNVAPTTEVTNETSATPAA